MDSRHKIPEWSYSRARGSFLILAKYNHAMNNRQFESKSPSVQRLEISGNASTMAPPSFDLAASPVQAKAESGQQENASENPEAVANEALKEQGMESAGLEQEEGLAIGKLTQVLSGDGLDVMTEQSMPMKAADRPIGTITKFRFGGVNFRVIDVGGDEKARSRSLLSRAIMLLHAMDKHDYRKHKATKTIRLYIGDYKAMVAYAQANPQLPYQKWAKEFRARTYSGNKYTWKYKSQVVPHTAATVAQSFVSTMYDPRMSPEEQRGHLASFLDMSQVDKFTIKKNDRMLKQIIDLALLIAHEATHTLTKTGGHRSGGTHLMEEGGSTSNVVDPNEWVLEDEAMVTDPKTGKQKLDMNKYLELAEKLFRQFGKEY